MHALSTHRNAMVMLVAWMLAAASGEATATCNPLERTNLYVGNTSADAQCSYETIQDAIDAVECPNTWVILTGEATYNDEHLTVNNHSFTLAGGSVAQCGDTPPVCDPTIGCGSGGAPPQTTIGGHNGDSVIHFEGESNVFLYNLDITGGNAGPDGSGGGLYFSGSGFLILNNTTVENNEAGYGGGIDISPSGGTASLTLQQNTLVIANTADTSGGGIRIEGLASLYVLEPSTLVAFNQANGASSAGFGGGLEVIAPARAYVGSAGYDASGVIANNLAEYGGGIAIVANNNGDGDRGLVKLFTTDPDHPVSISNNGASVAGGAIYLRPWINSNVYSITELCAHDFLMDDNQAPDGAALYADEYDLSLSQVALNTQPSYGFDCDPEPDLGELACALGVACNQIDSNIAADDSGHATDGSTIALEQRADAYLYRFTARENTGGHFLSEASSPSSANDQTHSHIHDALIADNANTSALIVTSGGPYLSIGLDSATISRNTDGTDEYLMHLAGDVSITNSIFDQLGSFTLDFQGGTLTDNYILTNDASTLNGEGVVTGAPVFVDSTHGDYHLMRTSQGVDFAPPTGGIDLDGHPRDIDLPDVPNQFGPRDLGAYEIQPGCSVGDTIYCNGFEND